MKKLLVVTFFMIWTLAFGQFGQEAEACKGCKGPSQVELGTIITVKPGYMLHGQFVFYIGNSVFNADGLAILFINSSKKPIMARSLAFQPITYTPVSMLNKVLVERCGHGANLWEACFNWLKVIAWDGREIRLVPRERLKRILAGM